MQIHSVIDVITNSSSELFICDTDKTINMVSEILAELVEVYKKATGDKREIPEMLFVTDCSDPKVNDAMDEYVDFYSTIFDHSDIAIAIRSTNDNSIPYCLFEFIEYVFNAKRYHLG
jgi:hypothetical protein